MSCCVAPNGGNLSLEIPSKMQKRSAFFTIESPTSSIDRSVVRSSSAGRQRQLMYLISPPPYPGYLAGRRLSVKDRRSSSPFGPPGRGHRTTLSGERPLPWFRSNSSVLNGFSGDGIHPITFSDLNLRSGISSNDSLDDFDNDQDLSQSSLPANATRSGTPVACCNGTCNVAHLLPADIPQSKLSSNSEHCRCENSSYTAQQRRFDLVNVSSNASITRMEYKDFVESRYSRSISTPPLANWMNGNCLDTEVKEVQSTTAYISLNVDGCATVSGRTSGGHSQGTKSTRMTSSYCGSINQTTTINGVVDLDGADQLGDLPELATPSPANTSGSCCFSSGGSSISGSQNRLTPSLGVNVVGGRRRRKNFSKASSGYGSNSSSSDCDEEDSAAPTTEPALSVAACQPRRIFSDPNFSPESPLYTPCHVTKGRNYSADDDLESIGLDTEEDCRPRLNSGLLRKSRDIQRLIAKQERSRAHMDRLRLIDDVGQLERMFKDADIDDKLNVGKRIVEVKQGHVGLHKLASAKKHDEHHHHHHHHNHFCPPDKMNNSKTKNPFILNDAKSCEAKPAVRPFNSKSVKDLLLRWCQIKTREYENVEIRNFSSSWADGMAFCALVHHFLPDAFDFSKLTPQNRRENLDLAFTTAELKADIVPLLEVQDMLDMGDKPDFKCIFTYVQSIYNAFKNQD